MTIETVQFRAMNTDIVLLAEGTLDLLSAGFDAVTQFILASERQFTRFSQDSELSQLNNAGGAWMRVSPGMLDVILLAREFMQQTSGLFNPTVLPNLQRIGYDRSMDIIRAQGVSPYFAPTAPQTFGFDEILIRPEDSLVSLPMGLTLDLGGIAKGWIAEKAANMLTDYSPVCGVNAGGDMFLVGSPPGQSTWPIDLENPAKPGETLVLLNTPPGAVATSSVAKRIWKQAGIARHHLIDPRTGEPARTEWLSVTVIAPHASQAEVFAKALLIAGPHEAHQLALNEDILYLAINQQEQIIGTKNSLELIDKYENKID